jgi:hypothetical protein
MTVAQKRVDEFDHIALDPAAIMDNAIALYFNGADPKDINVESVQQGIEKIHRSLLSITAKVMANSKPTTSLPVQAESGSPILSEVTSSETGRAVSSLQQPVSAPLPSSRQLSLELNSDKAPEHKTADASPSVDVPVSISTELITASSAPAVSAELPKRRKSDADVGKIHLPRRLSSVEDAVRMDTIICLEDGKAVVDLGAHLTSLGIKKDDYIKKWGLPSVYPMRAPSVIQKKGIVFEYDPIHNKVLRTA